MSQELTDAEWLNDLAEDLLVYGKRSDYLQNPLSMSARLRIIADRLERPGVEWQPIETHPKTFRQCLLCTADGHVQEGAWNQFKKGFDDGGEGFDIEPAYWMPLPAPPKGTDRPCLKTAGCPITPKAAQKRQKPPGLVTLGGFFDD